MTDAFSSYKNARWIIDSFGYLLDYDLRRGCLLRRHLVLGDYPSLYLDADTIHLNPEKENTFIYIHADQQKLAEFYICPQPRDTFALQNAETDKYLLFSYFSWYPEWTSEEPNEWEDCLIIDEDTLNGLGLLDDPVAGSVFDSNGHEHRIEWPTPETLMRPKLGHCRFLIAKNIETLRQLNQAELNTNFEFTLIAEDGNEHKFRLQRSDFEVPKFEGEFNPYF